MGLDISYHPIAADEIKSLYFDLINDHKPLKNIAAKFEIEEFYVDKLKYMIEGANEIESETPFNSGHGFMLAVVAGIYRIYWYTRGADISTMDESLLKNYITPWEELIPENFLTLKIENYLSENYSTGVYLSYNGLKKLRSDYDLNPKVKQEIDKIFSHDRLRVFWAAVDYAIDNKLGLIEATEVIEPNPFDLDKSTSYSNLSNCDPEGALLYQTAAREQLSDATEHIPGHP